MRILMAVSSNPPHGFRLKLSSRTRGHADGKQSHFYGRDGLSDLAPELGKHFFHDEIPPQLIKIESH
jgi:hypothetical protein